MYTTRQIADLLGVDLWRVQRIFEDGTMDEPPRFAGRRVIGRELIPDVVEALRDRGWIGQSQSREEEIGAR